MNCPNKKLTTVKPCSILNTINASINAVTNGIHPHHQSAYIPMSGTSMSGTSMSTPTLAGAMATAIAVINRTSKNGPTKEDIAEYAEFIWLASEKQGIIEDHKQKAYDTLVPEVQRVIAANMPPTSYMTCGEHRELPINIECDDTVWYGRNPSIPQPEKGEPKRRLLANAILQNNATLKVRWDRLHPVEYVASEDRLHLHGTTGSWCDYDLNNESELDKFFTDVITHIEISKKTDQDTLGALTQALGLASDYRKDDTEIAKFTKFTIPLAKKMINASNIRPNNP